jgi:carboxypeptidase Taq
MLSKSSYKNLVEKFHRIGVIGDAIGLLHWDQATMMPEGSSSQRAEQLATLSVLRHETLINNNIAELLDKSSSIYVEKNSWESANLREMKRIYEHATALPIDLVNAQSRANARCEMEWRGARNDDDYERLLPFLEEVLKICREVAIAKSESLGLSPYDSLLDQYEPGAKSKSIDIIFSKHANFLPNFLQEVLEYQQSLPDLVLPKGPFSIDSQMALGKKLMARIGFDFDRGRLDVSHHPFCGGGSEDIRITTRYDIDDFSSSLMGIMHETGHAMYELGLPGEYRYQPVGAPLGMAIHESQSLLIEMQVCRSRSFLNYAGPIMQEIFGKQNDEWGIENLHRLYTNVEPGFIRVDADEVTYPAHIILRYRLERALISGDLSLPDLPTAWNDGMKKLLGIEPPNNRLGCLQDIHWPSGDFGYFPTYTLGAMTAAQLYSTAKLDMPYVESEIEQGKFETLIDWLRKNIHSHGSRFSADQLLNMVTGSSLDPGVFQSHLKNRYLN